MNNTCEDIVSNINNLYTSDEFIDDIIIDDIVSQVDDMSNIVSYKIDYANYVKVKPSTKVIRVNLNNV